MDLKGSLQLLSASHLTERDKGLLRGVLSGEVWNGFILGHARGEIVPCRFCGEADGDGHLFWDCTHPPFVHILEIPKFHRLLNKDKSTWLRCLLWHGWSPALASPVVTPLRRILNKMLLILSFTAPMRLILMISCMTGVLTNTFLIPLEDSVLADDPDVWTDLSLVSDDLTGMASGGAGVFAHTSGSRWFGRRWGHLDLLPRDADLGVERCTLFDSLPGPLQSVQRAELWGVVLALQGAVRVHLGVDNLNVVRHVAPIISGRKEGRPFELCVDGDLLSIIENMIAKRGPNSTLVRKVKGHADMTMVQDRRARLLDKIGNDMADRAADCGRWRVHPNIIDHKRQVRYPLIPDLHRFFIAIVREAVNRDGRGGTSFHTTCWSAGGTPKRRKVLQAVRELAWVPGPPGLSDAGSVGWPAITFDRADVPRWPFSISSLVKLCAYLSSLHWPATVDDLGGGVELLILYENWAGGRLGV